MVITAFFIKLSCSTLKNNDLNTLNCCETFRVQLLHNILLALSQIMYDCLCEVVLLSRLSGPINLLPQQ